MSDTDRLVSLTEPDGAPVMIRPSAVTSLRVGQALQRAPSYTWSEPCTVITLESGAVIRVRETLAEVRAALGDQS